MLDYKTGPGDEPRYRRQIAIYGEIIRKTTAAPVRLVVLEIASNTSCHVIERSKAHEGSMG